MSESPALAHQFEDMAQQREAASLGIFLFLATEVLFFGGIILGYTVYRYTYPHIFEEASRHLYVRFGGTNTAVLLCSSFTMALAVHSAKTGARALLGWLLLATAALGCVFLVIKGFEYRQDYLDHLIPRFDFHYDKPGAPQAELFFFLYFVLTGLHALHVTIGIGLILVMAWLSWRRSFSPEYHTPVEVTGIYWHFVDIVWVFLFPLLYLVGHR